MCRRQVKLNIQHFSLDEDKPSIYFRIYSQKKRPVSRVKTLALEPIQPQFNSIASKRGSRTSFLSLASRSQLILTVQLLWTLAIVIAPWACFVFAVCFHIYVENTATWLHTRYTVMHQYCMVLILHDRILCCTYSYCDKPWKFDL